MTVFTEAKVHRQIVIGLALLIAPAIAHAQRNCKKGIPCGGTCISANKICRIGGSTSPSPERTPARAESPGGVQSLLKRLQSVAAYDTAALLLIARSGSTYLVSVPWAQVDSRPYYDRVTREFCPSFWADCKILFWPDTSSAQPAAFPLSKRHLAGRIAEYEQNGMSGSRAFYFLRGGRRLQ